MQLRTHDRIDLMIDHAKACPKDYDRTRHLNAALEVQQQDWVSTSATKSKAVA